eukprot:scaffold37918_cov54-Phaeocystis_antarctica.AAC.5
MHRCTAHPLARLPQVARGAQPADWPEPSQSIWIDKRSCGERGFASMDSARLQVWCRPRAVGHPDTRETRGVKHCQPGGVVTSTPYKQADTPGQASLSAFAARLLALLLRRATRSSLEHGRSQGGHVLLGAGHRSLRPGNAGMPRIMWRAVVSYATPRVASSRDPLGEDDRPTLRGPCALGLDR